MMARIRMALLYDRSLRDERLVIGTSNKTELLLGYGSVHGDMASALNPLGDLYKSQVRLVARRLGVPDAIVRKPPADLCRPVGRGGAGLPYDDLIGLSGSSSCGTARWMRSWADSRGAW